MNAKIICKKVADAIAELITVTDAHPNKQVSPASTSGSPREEGNGDGQKSKSRPGVITDRQGQGSNGNIDLDAELRGCLSDAKKTKVLI